VHTEDYVDAFARDWARVNPAVVARLAGDGAELQLIARVERLHGLLDEARSRCLRRHGLSRVEYDILSVLHASAAPGGLRSTAISRRLLITSGGTSTTLRRLERRGLVARGPDADDARSTRVRLTPAGAERVVEAALDVVPAQDALLGTAAARVVARASDALRDVLAAMGDTPASLDHPAARDHRPGHDRTRGKEHS
jgi:DNA-binding MarR family transcriptional regulator